MSGGDASPPQQLGGVEFVSPPSQGLDLDADNDVDDPLRFRLLDDIYARGAAPLEDAGGEQLKGSCCWPLVMGSRPRLRKLKGNSAGSRP